MVIQYLSKLVSVLALTIRTTSKLERKLSLRREMPGIVRWLLLSQRAAAAGVSISSERQLLFTYLHLAADRRLTEHLIDCGVTAIAYETVEQTGSNKLPLLPPSIMPVA